VHVHVRAELSDSLPPISEEEDEMLDLAASPRDQFSRLSCQLRVADLADSELLLPAAQL
jgi:2Fe-2S ferredoxin